MNSNTMDAHVTSIDMEVEEEIKGIKKFLIKGMFTAIIFLLINIAIASIYAYSSWEHEEQMSKLVFSLLTGTATFTFIISYFFRGMLFDFSKPEGVELSVDTPLYKIVTEISNEVKGPDIEKIFIVSDLNASVSTYRTLLSPKKRHYLSIGIQLISCVSNHELKSVVGHELGHLSKEHTNFSNFIYRAYMALYRFECKLVEVGGNRDFISKWVSRFIRRLDELSYSIKRSNEFQADEIAARIAGPEVASSALCRIHFVADWMEDKYWDSIWKNCWKYPSPQEGAIIGACKTIIKGSRFNLIEHFDKAKAMKTKEGDTHPSLSDRVEHLNQQMALPSRIEKKDMAVHWLGDKFNELLNVCDEHWREEISYEWEHYHHYISECIMRRDLLLKTKKARPLFNGEYFEIARLEEIVSSDKVAIESYLAVFKHDKRNIPALYEGARLLLKIHDDRAEPILNKTMKKCPILQHQGATDLAIHFDALGDTDKYKHYTELKQNAEKILKIREESSKERIIPHGLTNDEVDEVSNWIKHFGGVNWALLYRLRTREGGKAEYSNYQLLVSSDYYLFDGFGTKLMDGFLLNGTLSLLDASDNKLLTLDVLENDASAVIYGTPPYC